MIEFPKNKCFINGFFPGENFGDDLFYEISTHIFQNAEYRRKISSLKNRLVAIAKSRHYIFFGGTPIDEQTTIRNAISLLMEITYAKVLGKEVLLYGYGYTSSLPPWIQIIQRIIDLEATKVYCRDSRSFHFSRNKKRVNSQDLYALFSKYIKKNDVHKQKKYCLFSVDRLKKEKYTKIINHVKSEIYPCHNLVNLVTSRYAEEGQKQFSSALFKFAAAGNDVKLFHHYDYETTKIMLSESKYVFTTRLHVAMFALECGAKVTLFAHSQKLRNFREICNPIYLNNIKIVEI